MPTVWTGDAAERLADMLDVTAGAGWDLEAAVMAALHHPPGEPDEARLLTVPLDRPIPALVGLLAPDDECAALGLSSVFPDGRRRGGSARLVRATVAVSDESTAVVYRHDDGTVRRTDIVGDRLLGSMHALWDLRVRFELDRARAARPGGPAA